MRLKRLKRERIAALLMTGVMLLGQFNIPVYAENNADTTDVGALCEHHTEHTPECGYQAAKPGAPCRHEHKEDCYTTTTDCTHEHTEEYPEESECITASLVCSHEHDEICGYTSAAEGTPCGFVCSVCTQQDEDSDADSEPEVEPKSEADLEGSGSERLNEPDTCGIYEGDLKVIYNLIENHGLQWTTEGECVESWIIDQKIRTSEEQDPDVGADRIVGITFEKNELAYHDGCTTIDMSGLTALEYFSAPYIKDMQGWTLNLSGLKDLKNVYLTDSAINALDISGSMNVSNIYLSGTNLEKIYTSQGNITIKTPANGKIKLGEIARDSQSQKLSVHLAVEPKEGSTFIGWTGAAAVHGDKSPITLQLDGNMTVGASFSGINTRLENIGFDDVSGLQMKPKFQPDHTEYTVTVGSDVESISLKPKPEKNDVDVKITDEEDNKITGAVPLKAGQSLLLKIHVGEKEKNLKDANTSITGQKETIYKLTITREAAKTFPKVVDEPKCYLYACPVDSFNPQNPDTKYLLKNEGNQAVMISREKQFTYQETFNIPENYIQEILDDLKVDSQTRYPIMLPAGLKMQSAAEEEELTIQLADAEKTFGTLYLNDSVPYVIFNGEVLKEIQEDYEGGITNGHLYLGCVLDEDNLVSDKTEENRYWFEFEDGSKLLYGIQENEKTEQAATLEKKVKAEDSNDPTLLTWTITYHPYQNTQKTGFAIKDTLGEKHELVLKSDNTPEVTVIRGGKNIDGVKATYDAEKRTLTISNMGESKDNWEKPITITYQTRYESSLLFPNGGAYNTAGTISNSADLWTGNNKTDVHTDVTYTIPKTTFLRKEGEAVAGSNGRLIRWTVTVDKGETPDGTNIRFSDTLPEHLTLVTAEHQAAGSQPVKINGQTLQNQPTTNDEGTFIIQLSTDDFVDKSAKIQYDTIVAEEVFEQGAALGSNKAELNWTVKGQAYRAMVQKEVGKINGVSTTLLTKTGSYNPADHTITWNVSVNPNKANVTGTTTLRDDLSDKGLRYGALVSGSVKVDGAENEQAVIVVQEGSVVTFATSDLGEHTLEFAFTTEVEDSRDYAYNTGGKKYSNRIDMSYYIDNESKDRGVEAEGSVQVNSTVLKKAAGVYDYATNTITWTLTVNSNKMPMTKAKLEDSLPTGVDYVNGSLQPADAGISASQDKNNVLNINLGNAADKKEVTITYKTKVNVSEIEAFKSGKTVAIKNQVKLLRDNYTEKDVIASAEKEISSAAIEKDGRLYLQDGYIDYEVELNPHGLNLKEAAVTDSLPQGLQIDLDSIRLYKAAVSGQNDNPTFAKGEEVHDFKLENHPGDNSFTITLPNGEQAYILQYRADIVADASSYQNKIKFEGYFSDGNNVSNNITVPVAVVAAEPLLHKNVRAALR